ncbi:MAG: FtsX-like permease family protein, partial [Thermodesulfobacteriota bacterium]|nr:FtsX-like permease family protein [Thermodesulfobacteriota bacterium]
IRSNNFDEDHPYDTDNYLAEISSIENRLNNFEFVTGFTSRISFLSELDNTIDSTPVITIGIDQEDDKSVFSLERFIINGSLEDKGVLIGKSLSEDMNINLGDQIYLTFRNKEGMYTSVELQITGLVQTADPKVNNLTVFINIDEAKKYLGVQGVTEISFKTLDYKHIEKFEKRIRSEITNVKIMNWKELSKDFAALMATKRAASSYILLFIILIALVGIINTLLMSVYEKRQEIGTMMALGMENREVRNIFIFEGFMIGLLGSIFGLVLGTLINLYFIYVGVDYTALMGEGGMGFNVFGTVKSVWVFSAYFKSIIIVVLASILSSYYPAKKIMKMEPAECLRTVQ